MTEYYYRFEEQSYSVADEWGDHSHSHLVLHLRKLKVLRKTPKGVQLIGLQHGTNNPRFVNNDHVKRFAYPTIEEAATSFQARKNRQISIYEAKIKRVKDALFILDMKRYQEGRDW